MSSIFNRLQRAWSVFTSRSPTDEVSSGSNGPWYNIRPDRRRILPSNQKTIVSAIYTQIAIECRNLDVRHVQKDKDGKFQNEYDGPLNNCFKRSANLDQTGRAFIQDLVMSMLDEGCVAVVPTRADSNPNYSDSFNIEELRVGKITKWFPSEIEVELYDEDSGRKRQVRVSKRTTAIIENPLYAVMNTPNSTLQRLNRKLALLDVADESAYSKMDVIIQLPYDLRSDRMQGMAKKRSEDLENQLRDSRYGIGWAGISDKIIQLNRSPSNQLLDQINALKEELYSQLGVTKEVFDGTANEQVMLNFYNKTISPIMTEITEEMTRKFLSQNAITRGQEIVFFRNPFKLVPVNSIGDIADKFTRNAILSSNEFREIIGYKPSHEPDADALRNKNLNMSDNESATQQNTKGSEDPNDVNKLLENVQNGMR